MLKSLELKIPPPLWLVLVWLLMLTTDRLLPGIPVSLPDYITGGIAALMIVFGLGALLQFGLKKTTISPVKPEATKVLVTNGVYAISRNPMYLALAAFVVGGAFVLENLVTLLGLPLFIWTITRLQILPEERILEEKFGDEYRAYKAKVRRWL